MTSSSSTYSFGEVGITIFDFHDGKSPKARPVVIISAATFNDQRREVIVAPVSSQTSVIEFADFQVVDWSTAGLIKPGRVSALVGSIPRSAIRKRLGIMAATDQAALRLMLGQLFEEASPHGQSQESGAPPGGRLPKT